ncbi:methyltransferase [Amycolatopsis sp. VC5-11]|uniref:methyltransferase n=1 Tax=Amycolatopsis sp. VC5-11 TaxID=3120156 RepID=UPI00300AAE38
MSASTSPDSSVARARSLMQLNNAYFQSKVLQSACELGVFEVLADGPLTAEELCAKTGIRHRMSREYFNAMVGLGLLDCDEGAYRNSALSRQFLVPGAEAYLGGTAQQHAKLHFLAWAKLSESLRDGHAKGDVKHQGTSAFTDFYSDLDRTRRMMAHLDAHNGFMADDLAKRLDWRDYRHFADVGGARGNVAARLVRAMPHLHGVSIDLPQLAPLFEERMRELGTTGKVEFLGLDFFAEPLPETDVLISGHVLPDWPAEQREELVGKFAEAVRPGGTVVIYDAMVDDVTDSQDPYDPDALLRRIGSTLLRDTHLTPLVSEYRELLEKAGFRFEQTFVSDTIARDHVVVAVKP